MKKLIGMSIVALISVGCDNTANKPIESTPAATAPTAVSAPATTPAAPAPAVVSYFEVEHNGRLYVTASKASADKVATGGELAMALTKIGSGPEGKTLVIEASKDGVEKALWVEYGKRHPGN